jgi:putative membrane protein
MRSTLGGRHRRPLRRPAASFAGPVFGAASAFPGLAHAHAAAPIANELPLWLALLPLVAAAALYALGFTRRANRNRPGNSRTLRALSFAGGIALLATALAGIDAWAAGALSAHMLQHMLLIALAPPLLLLGRPGAVWLASLPRAWRVAATGPLRWRVLAGPRRVATSLPATALVHGAVLWAWHIPAAFELALRVEAVHWLEHLTLLAAGLLFWNALLRARGVALGCGVMWMLVTIIHSGMLGALITLAPRPLYATYLAQGVTRALADQQLAGLIMWVPMGTVYLAAALAFAARGLRRVPAS